MCRIAQSRRTPAVCEVIEMTPIGQLLEQMNLQDAIVSLAEVRAPIVVGDLDFYAGTWKGLPLHPKEIGQMEDIAESLSEEQQMVIKYSALLVNWGRKYEIARLLQTTSLGNLSSANAVLGVGGGDKTADEGNENVANSNIIVVNNNI
jgi:hypothetical protein